VSIYLIFVPPRQMSSPRQMSFPRQMKGNMTIWIGFSVVVAMNNTLAAPGQIINLSIGIHCIYILSCSAMMIQRLTVHTQCTPTDTHCYQETLLQCPKHTRLLLRPHSLLCRLVLRTPGWTCVRICHLTGGANSPKFGRVYSPPSVLPFPDCVCLHLRGRTSGTNGLYWSATSTVSKKTKFVFQT
jgi:hypothetical protein